MFAQPSAIDAAILPSSVTMFIDLSTDFFIPRAHWMTIYTKGSAVVIHATDVRSALSECRVDPLHAMAIVLSFGVIRRSAIFTIVGIRVTCVSRFQTTLAGTHTSTNCFACVIRMHPLTVNCFLCCGTITESISQISSCKNSGNQFHSADFEVVRKACNADTQRVVRHASTGGWIAGHSKPKRQVRRRR